MSYKWSANVSLFISLSFLANCTSTNAQVATVAPSAEPATFEQGAPFEQQAKPLPGPIVVPYHCDRISREQRLDRQAIQFGFGHPIGKGAGALPFFSFIESGCY